MAASTQLSSLAEKSYRVLESGLVKLELAPGSLVSEGELIDMTGYGRTPVREAIQRLARQDLFEVIPRKGLLVAPVSRSGLLHILEARRPLERLIAGRAALVANDKQRTRLAALAREISSCHRDFDRFLMLSAQIDSLMDECCGNPYAIQSVAPLRTHCRRFWYFYREELTLDDSIAVYSKLTRLVARRDVKGVEKAIDAMIQLLERLVDGLDRLG